MSGVSIATGVIATDALGGGIGRGLQSPGIVASKATTGMSITGTLVETTLATVVLPANMMGVDGVLRITPLWSMTNNANAKTLMVKVGGTTISTASGASNASYQPLIVWRNRGVQNAQVSPVTASIGVGFNGSAPATFAVNTAIDQNITFTATLGNVGDTITLEGYLIEVINP